MAFWLCFLRILISFVFYSEIKVVKKEARVIRYFFYTGHDPLPYIFKLLVPFSTSHILHQSAGNLISLVRKHKVGLSPTPAV